jgi:glucose-1-phosphate thymidylyltransferase
MKGVMLCGGHGTRMREFTSVINKALAPIYQKEKATPQLLFPLRTLVNSGITDILITSSREHCGDIIEFLGDGHDYGCKLTYKIQEMNRNVVGIAQALGLAEDFVGDEKFAVILGDNYYQQTFSSEVEQFEQDKHSDCYLFLKEVPDAKRFGVAQLDQNGSILNIEEKPSKPKSNLAVTGLYFYSPHVFTLVKSLIPSARNELEITDVNNRYVDFNTARGMILSGHWQDMGLPKSALTLSKFLSK